MELIYCAGNNKQYMEIALSYGFLSGARLPAKVYHEPLYFSDNEYKAPDRAKYVEAVAKFKPYMATVLDWMEKDQLTEILGWAEDIAPYVEEILIIPKVWYGIAKLPRVIGGKPVRLAYSVPTKYGGTDVPLVEFVGWKIHLLGGSPLQQYKICSYAGLNVVSCDGNGWNLHARQGRFFQQRAHPTAKNKHYPRLSEVGDYRKTGVHIEAFRRSCENIVAMFNQVPKRRKLPQAVYRLQLGI